MVSNKIQRNGGNMSQTLTDNNIEINGVKYVRQGSDFTRQKQQALDLIGDWLGDILRESDAIVAGGAILSIFTQTEVSDIDVYFRSREDLVRAFVLATKDWDNIYLGHTDKSITIKDRTTDSIVQFIYFDYFNGAEEVFKAFDFTVCMAAIELYEDKEPTLVLHPDFLVDVASRTLHFNRGTRFPYISLIRTKKYQDKGYKIGKGHLLAIAAACATRPITNWDEAKEQLGGVYGDAIQAEIDEHSEFSQDALDKVMTTIREHTHAIHSLEHDYEKAWYDLTGTTYGTDEAKNFGKVMAGEAIKKEKPLGELDF